MQPDLLCIESLTEKNFIRNIPFDRFLERNGNSISLNNHICYTVGIASEKRVVHAFRFVGQSPNSKIKSYLIEWWNVVTFPTLNENCEIESIQFWVHSGMTLRKNFFLFDDRLSLFRSTFIYDRNAGYYHRLINIMPFCVIPEISNYQQKVYTSPGKFSVPFKMSRVPALIAKNPCDEEVKKHLRKITKSRNLIKRLEKVSPQLLSEIEKFVKNGNTTR